MTSDFIISPMLCYSSGTGNYYYCTCIDS